MRKSLIVGILTLAAGLAPAQAQQRIIFGTRSLAMGGTTVAISSDASAAFGNPAAFALEDSRWDFTFPLMVLQLDVESDILATTDEINASFDDVSLSEIQDALNDGTVTPEERQTILDVFLYDLPELADAEGGVTVRASLGPAFRFRNWGFSAAALAYGGIGVEVNLLDALSLGTQGFLNAIPSTPDSCGGDAFCQSFANDLVQDSGGLLTNAQAEQLVSDAGIQALQSSPEAQRVLREIVQATAGGLTTLGDNSSGADLRGILLEQYAFTYSHALIRDHLALGGNVKFLRAQTFGTRYGIDDFVEGKDMLAELDDRDNRERSSGVGLDAGVLWTPGWGLRLGLSGRNLNNPEFDFAGGRRTFELQRLVRAGFGWMPRRWVTLGADLDLNAVDSQIIQGSEFRYVSLGAEFMVPKVVAFRAGAYTNLGAEDRAITYTGGLGFSIGGFKLDISGAYSTEEREIETLSSGGSETISAGTGVGISFGWQSRAGRKVEKASNDGAGSE